MSRYPLPKTFTKELKSGHQLTKLIPDTLNREN